MTKASKSPYDVNGQNFNSELFVQKLFRECSLKQVMDLEAEIVRDTQTLHSDMQTLVYENYNKFISATDTIRKMKCDFNGMEESMNSLTSNMDNIASLSDSITVKLQKNSEHIIRLTSVHTLLTKLQFLFKLPENLKDEMGRGNYAQAVKDYTYAQQVLDKYGHMPSLQGIQKDCEMIIEDLKCILRAEFHKKDASTKSLAESVGLLLKLKEPVEALCLDFLNYAKVRLSNQLEQLKSMIEIDVIEFVDVSSSGFLNDLCLIVATFKDMFINRIYLDEHEVSDDFDVKSSTSLNAFVVDYMQKYFNVVGKRVENVADTVVLVRALDRFHKRINAINSLCDDHEDFARSSIEIIISAGRKQCRNHLHGLKQYLSETLFKVRQTLASKVTSTSDDGLPELQATLVIRTIEKVKGVLQDLMAFLQPELSFALKPHFLQRFCIDEVREGLVVGFLHHLTATANGFCTASDGQKFPPALQLLLSKMCVEFKESSTHYLLSSTDDLFNMDQFASAKSDLTPESEICDNFQKAAQELLNNFVRLQGLIVSKMIRKSVETRDWLHTIEPRTVRAVMKRVVEDITAIEAQIVALYGDSSDGQQDRSSDSSRKTQSQLSKNQYSNWSSSNNLHSSLLSNIHKLFSERIEIFTFVEFKKASILTGIIKIVLKTFVECVRLRTFSKFGLQQIQVDTHYLQLYLWRFVNDEHLIHFLLDEILGSAFHRCLEPVLMEPSVVDIICERN